MENNSNFGSTSYYCSYGNRANYGLIDKSSITQFAYKTLKSELKTLQAGMNAEVIENLYADDLTKGVLV